MLEVSSYNRAAMSKFIKKLFCRSAPKTKQPPVSKNKPTQPRSPVTLFVQELIPFTNTGDFSLHPRVIQTAYEQIAINGNIVFPHAAREVRQLLLNDPYKDSRETEKALYQLVKGELCQWPLYDRCIELCRMHNIYPAPFDFLEDEPQPPQNVEHALALLSMDEIKPLLKAKGCKVGGKRAELEARAMNHLDMGDLSSVVDKKLSALQQTYQKKTIRKQYELLIHFIMHRAYFLHEAARNVSVNKHGYVKFIPELTRVFPVTPEHEQLAMLLDGMGYNHLIQHEEVMRFLPLYPGDPMDVRYQYQSRHKTK